MRAATAKSSSPINAEFARRATSSPFAIGPLRTGGILERHERHIRHDQQLPTSGAFSSFTLKVVAIVSMTFNPRLPIFSLPYLPGRAAPAVRIQRARSFPSWRFCW